MANLSENPSSPPKETTPIPSITPSTTPTSKKGRLKLMARKVVIGGEQIKKINEQFKASREEEPHKSDESFKSIEGEETASSEIEQVISGPKVTPKIISEVATNLENRDSSYKRENYKERENYKSEAELENALEESKRKVAAKGKRKVIEPIEAVEIEEMDLVLRDEEEAEEMEVVTPKAKKSKTSTKKSISKTKSVDPSTLAKRTRSALKSRKVKVVEEEEEEEFDAEKDKMVKLGREQS
uniref:Uncharacterized protein n=1 Tax=Nicotiana tabacum TaxID=4097 RepID=A0A1S4DQ95_TOBAC|nr:PREDICTED: uncharacterized protein LOC107832017 [Nicotiana tabacum]